MTNSQPRFVYLLLALAALFVISWGIKASAFILNSILLATVITIVILPFPQKLTQMGMPSWFSLALTLLAVAGAIVIVLLLLGISVAGIVGQQSTSIDTVGQALSDAADELDLGAGVASIVSWAVGLVANSLVQLAVVLMIFVFMLGSAIGGARRGDGSDHTGGLYRN